MCWEGEEKAPGDQIQEFPERIFGTNKIPQQMTVMRWYLPRWPQTGPYRYSIFLTSPKSSLLRIEMFCPESSSPWMNVNVSNSGFKAKPNMYMTQCLNNVFVFIYSCLYLYLHSHLNLYLLCVQVEHLLCLANARSHASHLIHVWR